MIVPTEIYLNNLISNFRVDLSGQVVALVCDKRKKGRERGRVEFKDNVLGQRDCAMRVRQRHCFLLKV